MLNIERKDFKFNFADAWRVDKGGCCCPTTMPQATQLLTQPWLGWPWAASNTPARVGNSTKWQLCTCTTKVWADLRKKYMSFCSLQFALRLCALFLTRTSAFMLLLEKCFISDKNWIILLSRASARGICSVCLRASWQSCSLRSRWSSVSQSSLARLFQLLKTKLSLAVVTFLCFLVHFIPS